MKATQRDSLSHEGRRCFTNMLNLSAVLSVDIARRPHAPALFKGVMPSKTFITCKAFLAGDGHVGQIIWLIMHEYEEARRAAETPGTL